VALAGRLGGPGGAQLYLHAIPGGTLGKLAGLLRTAMTRPDVKLGGLKPVPTLVGLYRLFLVFFLVVHEGHRLRHPLGPGWIIFIQFNFIIKITKVMIDQFIGIR
jgi:hypothetical protein